MEIDANALGVCGAGSWPAPSAGRSQAAPDVRPPDSKSPIVTAPHLSSRGTFEARVLAVVRRIPYGRVSTYGDVAEMAGHPRAWRAVGAVMRACRAPSVPCHRVVAVGGRLGGYSNPLRKRQLLQAEGLSVGRDTIREFAAARWTTRRRPR